MKYWEYTLHTFLLFFLLFFEQNNVLVKNRTFNMLCENNHVNPVAKSTGEHFVFETAISALR